MCSVVSPVCLLVCLWVVCVCVCVCVYLCECMLLKSGCYHLWLAGWSYNNVCNMDMLYPLCVGEFPVVQSDGPVQHQSVPGWGQSSK